MLKINKVNGIFGSMLNLLSGEKAEEIDTELPFAVMMFATMATSGITIYESWKNMQKAKLLPKIQKDAQEMVRQVEILGHDPLTVMYQRSEKTSSKMYRDFLSGFVSSIRSGGDVVSYLRSKMRTILESQHAAATRSIEKLATLIEAYAVMLIVTLCTYILYIVISSTAIFELAYMRRSVATTPSPFTYLLIFVLLPLISIVFMAIANSARKSNFISIAKPYKQAAIPTLATLGFFLLVSLVPPLQPLMEIVGLPAVVTVCFVVTSIIPAIAYQRIAETNNAAEQAMPSFLRDVTEARKIGLSPEKSIIHASKRTGVGRFSETLELIRSQLEWGIALRRVFANIKKKIQSWPVLVHFFILMETIEIGGGSPTALEILAEYSEKNKGIEDNKRSMLKPYIILAFVWSILIALTTTVVALTIYMLANISLPGMTQVSFGMMQYQINLFSVGIIFQCWMSGFFIGKINEGTFAAGFKYSAMLAATAYASLLLSQSFLSGIFTIAST